MRIINARELRDFYSLMRFKYSCIGAGVLMIVVPCYIAFLYFENNYDYSFTFSKKKKDIESITEVGSKKLSDEEVERILALLENRRK